jgi:hypothetical protein
LFQVPVNPVFCAVWRGTESVAAKNTSTIASAGWRPIHRRRDRRALLEVVKTPWTEPLVTQRLPKLSRPQAPTSKSSNSF